jgi:hypothetical protein
MKSLYTNGMGQCINRATGKLKKTFNTFEEAVEWAKRMNENPKFIHKQVAYKCRHCLKFHTGRSPHNTLLTHEKNIYKND